MNKQDSPLKFARVQRGLTQKQVAELFGITQSGYSEIEMGRVRLSSENLRKLCKELSIDPRLFTTTEPRQEWYKYLLNNSSIANEPGEAYGTPPNLTLLEIEKERLSRELEAYKAENAELRKLIQNR